MLVANSFILKAIKVSFYQIKLLSKYFNNKRHNSKKEKEVLVSDMIIKMKKNYSNNLKKNWIRLIKSNKIIINKDNLKLKVKIKS